RRYHFGAAGFSTWPAPHLHGHGPRRFAPAILRQNSSAVSHTAYHYDLDGRCGRCCSDGYKHRRARRSDEYRNPFRVYSGLFRRKRPAPRRARTAASVSRALRSDLPNSRRVNVPCSNVESASDDLDSFCGVAGDWAADLLPVQLAAQQTASRRRHRSNRRYSTAADQDVGRTRFPQRVGSITAALPPNIILRLRRGIVFGEADPPKQLRCFLRVTDFIVDLQPIE